MALVLAGRVELEPRRRDAALARLDAEHELRVGEPLPAIVQLHRVDHVAVRDSSCPEAMKTSSKPSALDRRRSAPRGSSSRRRCASETSWNVSGPVLLEERVAPDARAAVAAERLRPLHRRTSSARAPEPIIVAHVGVHVGDEDVQPAVVVEVEHLDAHRAPGRPREDLAALLRRSACRRRSRSTGRRPACSARRDPASRRR